MPARLSGGAGPAKPDDLAARRRARQGVKRDEQKRVAAVEAGPGSVALMRRNDESNREHAKTSGYKPRTAAQLKRAPIRPAPKSRSTGDIVADSVKSGIGPGSAIRAFRTVGHTLGAIGEAVTSNPADAADKTFKQATEIAKGLPAAAAVIPYTIAYPINKAIGNDPGDNPIDMLSRMTSAEISRISKTYGDSHEGRPGAYRKLVKQVKREGPLMPALDVATVVAPGSSAVGSAARRGTLGAKAAKATTTRPNVRYSGFGDAAEGRVRPSAIGATVGAAHDAARRQAQRVAVKRAEKTGKPLAPRRRNLQEGEVTPILSTRVKRRLKFETAELDTRGRTAARLRVKRYVTGKDGYIQAVKGAPKDARDAVEIARELGIRSSKDAKTIIPLRLAEIEKRTAEARAAATRGAVGRDAPMPTGKYAAQDVAAYMGKTEAVEYGRLKALLDDPSVFDRTDVLTAVDKSGAAVAAGIGAREGYGAERLAEGRVGRQGETVGVKRASDENAETRAAHEGARVEATRAVIAAKKDHAKVQATAKRTLAGARADLEHAKGRAEILSRNVSGKERVPGDKETGRAPSYAGGGHGVRQAEAALAKAKAAADEALGASHERVKAARAARTEANRAPLKLKTETHAEYAARVDAAFEARGLSRPEFTTSKFEEHDSDLRVMNAGSASTPANPGAKTRHGTNYRLGQQGHQMETAARDMRAAIERGARIEAEQNVLAKHGLYFPDPEAAKAFITGLGLSADDVAIFRSTGGVVRKDMASDAERKGAKDQGAYVSAKGVFVTDKVVHDELVALGKTPSNAARILQQFAHAPQAALLALSPSWFGFQRVNDFVGAAAGGSLLQTRKLEELRKGLAPEDADIATMMSGGSMTADFLTPRAGAKLGRVQRVLDENPTYKSALNSDKPATNLLIKAAHDGPTALLRADARITGRVRERQFMANLVKLAARMDPDVKAMHKGFGPLGHALKTGDAALMKSLLNDPKYTKVREDAVASLNRVMGDWHNFTATEKRLKGAFAFYGFLRYSTRMALYTLPVDHPYVGMLIAQVGAMGAEDAKAIIGPDVPYGLGALYNSKGTVAFDLTRANPITGPLTSITKPEHLFNLGTPLISIMASTALGQNIGLSDSATGYVKQMTVKGDPGDNTIGGFLSAERLRIFGDQVGSLLTPYKEWKRWDQRAQTSDSLPWDRRHSWSESGATQANIEAKNKAAGAGGLKTVARDLVPLLAPSDGRNVKEIGARNTAIREEREAKAALKAAKREGAQTPRGKMKLDRAVRDAQRAAAKLERAPLGRAELEQRRKLRDAQRGG